MKVSHPRVFYILIINLILISSLCFGETFIASKPVIFKILDSDYDSQSEGLKDKIPNIIFSISYGRFVNFDHIGFYLNGDMKPTKIQFTYPKQGRTHYNLELLTSNASIGFEYQRMDMFDTIIIDRYIVDLGFVPPVRTKSHYASHRFGVMHEEVNKRFYITETTHSETYLIWGMRGLRRMESGLLVRANFYVNPFAYLLSWVDWYEIYFCKDNSPTNHGKEFETYIHGASGSVGIPINSLAMLEFGFADYDVFELFARISLTI